MAITISTEDIAGSIREIAAVLHEIDAIALSLSYNRLDALLRILTSSLNEVDGFTLSMNVFNACLRMTEEGW